MNILSSLLPGLRELRAPLTAGYIWIAAGWIIAVNLDWVLPTERPEGPGVDQALWDLIALLGPTISVAGLTLAAYLIGSFLEIATDSYPVILVGGGFRMMDPDREFFSTLVNDTEKVSEVQAASFRVNRSFTGRAIKDAFNYFDSKALAITSESGALNVAQKTWLLDGILDEVPQLATRLLNANANLHDRYDRLNAEASFRVNIAAPISVLLTGICLRTAHPVVPIGVVLFVAFMLFWQGAKKAIQSRDIIVQALVIPEIGLKSTSLDESSGRMDGFAAIETRPIISRRRQFIRRRGPQFEALLGITTMISTIFLLIATISAADRGTVDTLGVILPSIFGGVGAFATWIWGRDAARRRERRRSRTRLSDLPNGDG